MARAREFEKKSLICGILSTRESDRKTLLSSLERNFGKILEISDTLDFPYTDYYDSEMGGHPVRYFILFEDLVDPSMLSHFKTVSNELEKSFECDSGRQINIDPGLLGLSSLVLATCKDRSHRIALSDGIFAEVTLIYQDHDFQSLPWTYADYSDPQVKSILRTFREKHKKALKQL